MGGSLFRNLRSCLSFACRLFSETEESVERERERTKVKGKLTIEEPGFFPQCRLGAIQPGRRSDPRHRRRDVVSPPTRGGWRSRVDVSESRDGDLIDRCCGVEGGRRGMDGDDVRVFDYLAVSESAFPLNSQNIETPGKRKGRTLGEGVEVFVREDGGRGEDVEAAREGSVQHVALDLGRLVRWCTVIPFSFQFDLVQVAVLLLCGAAVLEFELVEDGEDGRLEAVYVVQEAGRVLLLLPVEGHGRTEEGRSACFVDAGAEDREGQEERGCVVGEAGGESLWRVGDGQALLEDDLRCEAVDDFGELMPVQVGDRRGGRGRGGREGPFARRARAGHGGEASWAGDCARQVVCSSRTLQPAAWTRSKSRRLLRSAPLVEQQHRLVRAPPSLSLHLQASRV